VTILNLELDYSKNAEIAQASALQRQYSNIDTKPAKYNTSISSVAANKENPNSNTITDKIIPMR
jgi:hypothetical protein